MFIHGDLKSLECGAPPVMAMLVYNTHEYYS